MGRILYPRTLSQRSIGDNAGQNIVGVNDCFLMRYRSVGFSMLWYSLLHLPDDSPLEFLLSRDDIDGYIGIRIGTTRSTNIIHMIGLAGSIISLKTLFCLVQCDNVER